MQNALRKRLPRPVKRFIKRHILPRLARSESLAVHEAVAASADFCIYGYTEEFVYTRGTPVRFFYSQDFAMSLQGKKKAAVVPKKPPAPVSVTRYEVYKASTNALLLSGEVPETNREVAFQPTRSFDGRGSLYPNSLTIPTDGLEPGFYRIRLCGGAAVDTYFAVRPRAEDDANVLLVWPTFTMQAYNEAGGQSFYEPSGYDMDSLRTASLHRPLEAQMNDKNKFHHYPTATVEFEKALEAMGLAFSIADSYSLHHHPEYLDGKDLVILCGHDEYMTRDIRYAYHRYVENGGKLAIFSGNTGWYKVHLEDRQISIIYSGSDERPDRDNRTGCWDRPNINDPIERTFGLSYTYGGQPLSKKPTEEKLGYLGPYAAVRNGMVTEDPDHPVFRGTGLEKGESFGHEHKLIDVEIDGLSLDESGNIAPGTACPERMKILATGFVHRVRRSQVSRVPTMIECAYGEKGGQVLHFGSIGWYRSVATAAVTGRIFRNAVEYLLGDRMMPRKKPLSRKTVIIHGMSRSGTTLLNAMLDAHPDIATCYDVTPKRVGNSLDEIISTLEGVISDIGESRLKDFSDDAAFDALSSRLKKELDDDFSRLLLVCRRSVLDPVMVLETLKEARDAGFDSFQKKGARLKVAAMLVEKKRIAQGRQIAGVKIIQPPEQVNSAFVNPHWLYIIRDPRDVYASHVRMDWEATPETIAESWNARLDRLKAMQADPAYKVLHVSFERLVQDAETVSKEICDFIGVDYFDFSQYSGKADVFQVKNAFDPNAHIWFGGGVNKQRAGNWKNILSEDQARAIETLCAPGMKDLGYV